MKFLISSLLLLVSVASIAAQPKNVECIKKELKKKTSIEKAYQICSIKK